MKHLLLVSWLCMSCMAACSFDAVAGLTSFDVSSAGYGELSDSQQADILKIIADTSEKNKQQAQLSKQVSVEDFEKWANIGKNIGQGLGAAAKELGIAVNEFASSPIGRLTTMLIVWKIIGAQLIHVFGALCVWLIGFILLRILINHTYPTEIVYDTERRNIFGNYIVKDRKQEPFSSDMAIGFTVAGIIVIISGLLILFTM